MTLTKNVQITKGCRVVLQKIFLKDLDKYINIFFYEKPVSLNPKHAELLKKAGIIRPKGNKWLANVMIFPFKGKFIVTDFLLSLYKKKGDKYIRELDDVWVMFPHETLLFIDKLDNIRGNIALDIASGSGAISLFLADKLDKVISADINPKAVEFARFNAILNNLEDKITNVQSNLFSELKGRKFDYICLNGPTVAMPEVDEPEKVYPLYAYGGSDGVEFTKKFLNQVFNHTNKEFKIKWWDSSLGNSRQSVVEQYIRKYFSHLPIKVTIEFLNRRRGVNLKEYHKLYDKYCLDKFDLNQTTKQRNSAVKTWFTKLNRNQLTHVYIDLISIEPDTHFEIVYKDTNKTLVSARHVFGFEWHFASREFIKSYLKSKN